MVETRPQCSGGTPPVTGELTGRPHEDRHSGTGAPASTEAEIVMVCKPRTPGLPSRRPACVFQGRALGALGTPRPQTSSPRACGAMFQAPVWGGSFRQRWKPHLSSPDPQVSAAALSPQPHCGRGQMPACPPETQKAAAHAHTRFKLTSPFLVCPTQGAPDITQNPTSLPDAPGG